MAMTCHLVIHVISQFFKSIFTILLFFPTSCLHLNSFNRRCLFLVVSFVLSILVVVLFVVAIAYILPHFNFSLCTNQFIPFTFISIWLFRIRFFIFCLALYYPLCNLHILKRKIATTRCKNQSLNLDQSDRNVVAAGFVVVVGAGR